MTRQELLKRITRRPEVFGGKPIIRDMRISVELILSLMAQGESEAEILADYPDLEADDIRACIAYAHSLLTTMPLDAAGQQRNERNAKLLALFESWEGEDDEDEWEDWDTFLGRLDEGRHSFRKVAP